MGPKEGLKQAPHRSASAERMQGLHQGDRGQPARPTKRCLGAPRIGALKGLLALSAAAALAFGSVSFVYPALHTRNGQGVFQHQRPRTRRICTGGATTRCLELEPILVVDGDNHYSTEAASIGVRGTATEGPGEALPMCFSSPRADPSKGAWRKHPGGVEESPANNDGWELPSEGVGHMYTHLNR